MWGVSPAARVCANGFRLEEVGHAANPEKGRRVESRTVSGVPYRLTAGGLRRGLARSGPAQDSPLLVDSNIIIDGKPVATEDIDVNYMYKTVMKSGTKQ